MGCDKKCQYGCGLLCKYTSDPDHGSYHTCGRGPGPENGCPGLMERNAKRAREQQEAEARHRKEFLEANKPKRKKLDAMLDAFLAEPRLDGNGWAPVTKEDVENLYEIFSLIEEMKCDRDADGDSTLEFDITNRTTHERMHFRPVPYSEFSRKDGGATDWEVLEAAEFNLSVAQERFKTAFRIYEHHLRALAEARAAKKKALEQAQKEIDKK